MRQVGSNFDEKKADEIFDSIGKTNEKKISEGIKKDINLTKNVSELLKEAEESDDKTAIDIYEKILTLSPDNFQAYDALSKIFQKHNAVDRERDLLKKAIANLSGSKKEAFMKRLKEING